MDITNIPDVVTRPDEPIQQFNEPQFPFLIQVDQFLWVSQARLAFGVTGTGLTAAVLDSGLNTAHVDFAGRVVAKRNFTTNDKGDPDIVTDRDGHGTNVAGIIAANGDHIGMAPDANVIPLKVLKDDGGGSFADVEKALKWVIDHQAEFNITVVCMSLGAPKTNFTSDVGSENDNIRKHIQTLKAAKVAVVIAAGNDYFTVGSKQGMGYPAIFRECVSVGAVYDAVEGGFSYSSGAKAHSTRAGQITPFSQRLHATINADCATDIFAPGAPVTSSGKDGPHGESVQHGTSQAAPVTAGIILLMQDFYQKSTGTLPDVADLVTWMQQGSIALHDGDDEDDNVSHTNLNFMRLDALSALDAVRRHLLKLLVATP